MRFLEYSLPWRSPTARRLLVGIAAALLLCVYAAEVTITSRDLSVTWDEPGHILAGYRYWQAGDYGFNPEHPPLAKLVGKFPHLFMHLNVPPAGQDDSKTATVLQGRTLVYGNGADALLLRARLAEATLGLLLALLIFEAGYLMFGAGVAWIAGLLAVFEPNLLAHSTLVTTDFACACFYMGVVYALWRVAERPSLLRLAGCGVMSGLAFASKHSALLLPPTLALLAAVEVACCVRSAEREGLAPLPVLWNEGRIWVGRLVFIYGFATLVLWGFYGFRYHARPDAMLLWESLPQYASHLHGHVVPWLVRFAARFKLLPESYLFGLTDVLSVTEGPRVSFLLGPLYPHAVWYYFPVDFVIKSTLGFLALLILAVATAKSWSGDCRRKAAYVLIPPVFFMGVALTSGTNMGIRHVLPIYPFLRWWSNTTQVPPEHYHGVVLIAGTEIAAPYPGVAGTKQESWSDCKLPLRARKHRVKPRWPKISRQSMSESDSEDTTAPG